MNEDGCFECPAFVALHKQPPALLQCLLQRILKYSNDYSILIAVAKLKRNVRPKIRVLCTIPAFGVIDQR